MFSQELADRICRCIAEGKSLRAICNRSGLPTKSTVTRWLAKNDEFWDQYARAREQQAHALMDEAVDLARSAMGYDTAALRVQIDTLKWAAAKLHPKVYGKYQARDESPIEDAEPQEQVTSPDECPIEDAEPREQTTSPRRWSRKLVETLARRTSRL